MTPEEVKEARTLIRPYAKRIREASTGRETVVGHNWRVGDIHEEERGGYFSLALIAELGGGKTKLFCSMAAVKAWVAQQEKARDDGGN